MRKITAMLTVLLLAVSIVSCNGGNKAAETDTQNIAANTESEEALTDFDEEDVAKVVLKVDKETVIIGTGDIVTMSATCYTEDGEEINNLPIDYYADGKKLESCYYAPKETGYSNVFAKCCGVMSKSIEIKTTNDPVTSVTCTPSSYNIVTGEQISFKVVGYSNSGKTENMNHTVTINGTTSRVTAPNMEEEGIYTAFGSEGVIDSPCVMFAVKDEFIYNITLKADSKKVTVGDTVNFTMDCTRKSDGVPANAALSVTLCGNGEIGDSYTFTEAGVYNFCVVYDGEVSDNLSITVTEPDNPDEPFEGYTSSVPVIVIDTGSKSINQAKAIKCTVRVYGSVENGAVNGESPTLVTNGEIKLRGQSSLGFEKKQYSLHTVNEDGSNNNVSLLGLPKENDWVLNGSYADKSLIRNSLAQNILSKVMEYTCRTQYCEVYLKRSNGTLDYIGLYTLIEKIKIDDNRLDIDKLTEDDNEEPEITGGYIIALDKIKTGDNSFDTVIGTLTVVRPKADVITDEQDDYIKDYMTELTSVIKSDLRNDPDEGASKYIDFESFAAPLAITEFLRNVDGFVFSTYMYKERDGLLKYGPGWDYDLSVGNADYNDCANPEGWYVVKNSSLIRNIMRVDEMSELFVDTWNELRKDILSDENIDLYIDNELEKAGLDSIARSCSRYPNHWNGTYVWPNYNYGEHFTQTHTEEIEMMRSFLHERAEWMDEHIDELYDYPY